MEGVRVVWPEKGRAELESFVPPEPRPGEVLIESEVTLLSPGTERAFFLGLPNAQTRYPSYPGYSNIGRVVALGEGVEGVRIGDRVASGGNHASHVVVRTGRCWPVPQELPAKEAVFFNLGAIAIQGVRKARVELGESVLGLGLGLIGNLALQLARLQGGLPTIGLDPDAGRREIALACAVDHVLDPSAPESAEALHGLTDGRGPAVVIEATGSPEAVNDALALAGHRARVVLLASTRGVTETNFYRDVHKKGLTLLGAHANVVAPHDSTAGFWTLNDEVATVMRLLASKRLQVGPLQSEVFPWKEAPRAYELLGSWRKDVLGMLLRWRG
jgi:2-desacetyl-2-hydroxyethyl bacteriochlorophyllide A dehydrogenase